MRVLLARVGYMKFYQGSKPGDERPIGGGSYNDDDIGSEVYNFLNIEGILYGYFQPHMQEPYEINLGRIQKNYKDNEIDDVLVIWFATNPISGGQFVVGWYKNATVFRSPIEPPDNLPQRENRHYYIKAKAENCALLPISRRRFPIGHDIKKTKKGIPGTSNAFYILDEKGNLKNLNEPINAWITNVIEYVEKYDGSTISSKEDEIQEDMLTAQYSSGGQGFQSDVETRLMIESYAMEICKNYCLERDWEVQDVSANRPYDFIIRKNNKEYFVEVKGTQSTGDTIILTKNEVELSRTQGDKMILFIVHSIVMNKKTVRKESSKISIIKPWQVKEERLTPISFTYRVN